MIAGTYKEPQSHQQVGDINDQVYQARCNKADGVGGSCEGQ